jgi:hypothetical protein
MLQAGRYVCDREGSRAAELEAEPGGVVPSERAEIQVRSYRATGAGELVKFAQPVWYRFSFKIAGDWQQDIPVADASPAALSSIRSRRIPSRAGGRATPAPSSRSRRGRSAARALLRAGSSGRTLRGAADGDADADLPARPVAGELDHGAGAPQPRP